LDLEEGIVTVAEGMDDGMNKGQAVNEEGEAEGWMDLDEYQREQSIEGGEIGERLPGVAEESEEEEGAKTHRAKKIKTKDDVAPAKVSKPIDRVARKREKKARLIQERKLKIQKLRSKAE
jgi:hypothetical protein